MAGTSGKPRNKSTNDRPLAAALRGGPAAVRLVGESTPKPARRLLSPGASSKPEVKPRRGDAVRDRILRAALECFGAFGFEGTSTRAVAQRADVTHTLVLYHFQSKDQLWISMMEAALDEYAGELRANLTKADERSAKEVLSAFVEQFVRMSARCPQIHRILTTEGNQDTQRLTWIIEYFIRWHFTVARDLIRRGQADGTIRECDPARLYYLIIAVGGTPFTLSTEYRAITGRDVFSEAEVLRNIAFIYEIVFT